MMCTREFKSVDSGLALAALFSVHYLLVALILLPIAILSTLIPAIQT